MNFGIIAAGEGSRLVTEGAVLPKPLLEVDGEPMIARLIHIFERCGASSINIVINDMMPQVKTFLENFTPADGVELNFRVKTTPSSMHTFAELAKMLRGRGRFIATTVDTIFRESEFRKYAASWEESPDKLDGLMAVTDYVDDEKPLYVSTTPDLEIDGFLDTPKPGVRYISGGIYGLGERALEVLADCMKFGVSRMRNYQRALIEEGLDLKAYPMGKIIDVDHMGDLSKANVFLKSNH